MVLHGDGGGKARALGRPMTEPARVAHALVSGFRRIRGLGVTYRPAWVNGRPGAVMYDAEGHVAGVVGLDIADGVVRTIHSVANPDKLCHLGPVSGVGLLPER